MSFILYTLFYFIFGFIAAKLLKAYNTFNKKEVTMDYAWFAILWLPLVILTSLGYLYRFLKTKL